MQPYISNKLCGCSSAQPVGDLVILLNAQSAACVLLIMPYAPETTQPLHAGCKCQYSNVVTVTVMGVQHCGGKRQCRLHKVLIMCEQRLSTADPCSVLPHGKLSWPAGRKFLALISLRGPPRCGCEGRHFRDCQHCWKDLSRVCQCPCLVCNLTKVIFRQNFA